MANDTAAPVDELGHRKLDEAIATEVMGLDPTPGFGYAEHETPPEETRIDTASIPCYSSEPMGADTWSVVEEILSGGAESFSIFCRERPDKSEVAAVIEHPDIEWSLDYTETFADTAPLAICRAALKAVRGD